MEKQVKAVFYKFKYYIFPEEFQNLNQIACGTVINAKRLKEENCMAPDFIYESMVEESVEIEDTKLLFEASVNLYSAKEYDACLSEQVKRVCPGCRRFIDDGKELDLEGHYREISLNGVCYEREDERSVSLLNRIYWFYGELSEHLDELADCIEKGDGEKFNEICQESAKYVIQPVKFFGDKSNGKYRLYWQTSLGSELYYTIMHLVGVASKIPNNPLTEAGWEVLPFIPQKPENYDGSLKEDEPVASLTQSQVPWRYLVNVYTGKTGEDDIPELIFNLHRYLSYNLGENVVINAVEGYEITEDKGSLISPAEICERLKQKIEEWDKNNESSSKEFPPLVPYSWDDEGVLPYKRSVGGTSICYSLASIGVDTDIEKIHFDLGFSYAYIFIKITPEKIDGAIETLWWYFTHATEVPQPIRLEEDFYLGFSNVGICECSGEGLHADQGIAIDFILADEKEFYRFVKIIAPVLKSYSAKLVVVNDAGVNEYVCGYEITPVSTEENN